VKNRLIIALAGSAFAALALAGCSSSATPATGGAAASSSPSASSGDLATTTTSLGTVIVDGTGMTAYLFDEDTKGEAASACTGGCATAWPAITTTSATPTVTGVTGTIGTIPTADGGKQITVNGLPLYTYASDTAKGDIKGQGVGGTWWVAGADGTKITSSASTGSGNSKGGY
jgi:predicted lipoprotein with Yx(FWY)xxD motif